MRLSRRLLSAGMLLAPVLGQAQPAAPNRPIRLIVPFPPGGGVDLTARLLADPLAKRTRPGVVVENRGGAGGVIGVEAMANSPADGLHPLADRRRHRSPPGRTCARLPYDPFGARRTSRAWCACPSSSPCATTCRRPTLPEFMAWARGHEIRWASGGIGTSQHLAGELFRQMSGLSMVHVPYRGTGPALNDLAAGVVDAYFGDPATLGLITRGKARAMAVTSPERWPLLPGTPAPRRRRCRATQAENWYGLAAPPGTPEPVVQRLAAAVRKVMADPADGAALRGCRAASGDPAARGLPRLPAGRIPRPGRASCGPATSGWTAIEQARLAVDIGGTFTDLVLETADARPCRPSC